MRAVRRLENVLGVVEIKLRDVLHERTTVTSNDMMNVL
jgi:hypothetical protein